MRKTNSVIRDADGFNVSAAKSKHDGIEVSVDVDLHDYWSLTVNGAFAKHVYDFDSVAARGETFVSGNDIDTAPRWLGSAALNYEGPGRLVGELQWVSQGSYYLDAENLHTYPGMQTGPTSRLATIDTSPAAGGSYSSKYAIRNEIKKN
jgi:outer membrane receptor protein involved in Fe transport